MDINCNIVANYINSNTNKGNDTFENHKQGKGLRMNFQSGFRAKTSKHDQCVPYLKGIFLHHCLNTGRFGSFLKCCLNPATQTSFNYLNAD